MEEAENNEGNRLFDQPGDHENIGGQGLCVNRDQMCSVAKAFFAFIVILVVNIFLLMLLVISSMFLRLESSSLDQLEYLLVPSNTSFVLPTPAEYLDNAGVKFSFVDENLAETVSVRFILREAEMTANVSTKFKILKSNGVKDPRCRIVNGQETPENCYIVRYWKSKPSGTLQCKSNDNEDPSATYLVWKWFPLDLTRNEEDNFYNFSCPKEANKLENFLNCAGESYQAINVENIFNNGREPNDNRTVVSMQFCLKPDPDNHFDDIGYLVNFTELKPFFGSNNQYNSYTMGRDTDTKSSEVVVPLVPGVDKSVRIIVDGRKTEPIELRYEPIPSANQIIERHHINVDSFIHDGSIGILCASILFFLCFNGGVIAYVRTKCRRQDNHD